MATSFPRQRLTDASTIAFALDEINFGAKLAHEAPTACPARSGGRAPRMPRARRTDHASASAGNRSRWTVAAGRRLPIILSAATLAGRGGNRTFTSFSPVEAKKVRHYCGNLQI
jgi:hypothetical protein